MTKYKKIGNRYEYLFSAGGAAGSKFLIGYYDTTFGRNKLNLISANHVAYDATLAPSSPDQLKFANNKIYASDGRVLVEMTYLSEADRSGYPENPEIGVYEIYEGVGDARNDDQGSILYDGRVFNSWDELRRHLAEGRTVLWTLDEARMFALFTYRGVNYIAPAFTKATAGLSNIPSHLNFLTYLSEPGLPPSLVTSVDSGNSVGPEPRPNHASDPIRLGTRSQIQIGEFIITYDSLDARLIGYVYAIGGQSAVDNILVPSLWPIASATYRSLNQAVINAGVNSGGYGLTRLTGHVLIDDPRLIVPASGSYTDPVDGGSYVSTDAFDSTPQDRLYISWGGYNHQRVKKQTMLHQDACIVRLKDARHPLAIVTKARAATLVRGSDDTPYVLTRSDGSESPVTNGRALASILATIVLSTDELSSKVTLDGVYASASPAYLLAAVSRPSVNLAGHVLCGSPAAITAVSPLVQGLTAKTISVTDAANLDLKVIQAAPDHGSDPTVGGLVSVIKSSADPSALARALENLVRDKAAVPEKYAVSPLVVDKYSKISGYSQDVTSPFYKLVHGVLTGEVAVTNTMGHPSAKQVVTTAPYDPRYLALFSGIVAGTIRVDNPAGSPARGLTLAYALRKHDDGGLPLEGEGDDDTLSDNYLDIFKYDLRKVSVADELGHPILAAMTSGTPFNVRGVLSGVVEHFAGGEQEGLSRIATAMEESYTGGDTGRADADTIITSIISLIEERNRLKQRLQTCGSPDVPPHGVQVATEGGVNVPLLAAIALGAYVVSKRKDGSK